MTAQRRKTLIFAIAVFTFGVAFAAEPTALRTGADQGRSATRAYWVPGSTIPMSAYEQGAALMPLPH
jgi:hypothetical protein